MTGLLNEVVGLLSGLSSPLDSKPSAAAKLDSFLTPLTGGLPLLLSCLPPVNEKVSNVIEDFIITNKHNMTN